MVQMIILVALVIVRVMTIQGIIIRRVIIIKTIMNQNKQSDSGFYSKKKQQNIQQMKNCNIIITPLIEEVL